MTIYLDCYTYPEDLLRAVSANIPFSLYNDLFRRLEAGNLSKDQLVQELKDNNVSIKKAI